MVKHAHSYLNTHTHTLTITYTPLLNKIQETACERPTVKACLPNQKQCTKEKKNDGQRFMHKLVRFSTLSEY